MTSYYDALNSFHRQNALNPLSTAAQLMYLHLLHINNGLGNGGLVKATDSRLASLMCVTRQTVINARRTLKNAGLIDFTVDAKHNREGVKYELLIFNRSVDRSLYRSVDRSVDRSQGVPITHVREDQTRPDTSADGTHARTDCVNVDDELVEVWLANRGALPTAELLSCLSTLVNRYGRERTEEFIKSAARKYGGEYRITPDFLQKHIHILEGGLNRDKVVSINARRDAVGQQYAQPDTRYDSEFGL